MSDFIQLLTYLEHLITSPARFEYSVTRFQDPRPPVRMIEESLTFFRNAVIGTSFWQCNYWHLFSEVQLLALFSGSAIVLTIILIDNAINAIIDNQFKPGRPILELRFVVIDLDLLSHLDRAMILPVQKGKSFQSL